MVEGREGGKPPAQSSLAPFRHAVFAVLWCATVVSNVGVWMQNAAAGWLMTSLSPDPLVVSLVQVATALPMFAFAVPAGALADIVDRRKLLVVVQVAAALLVMGFGLLVWLGRVTSDLLLIFTFAAASAAALVAPAWQSIVPQLVPRDTLQPAVALNSVGINVSRAVGPALTGFIIGAWGMAAPFWINALTTLGVIAGLVWWRPPPVGPVPVLPPERFGSAMRAGLRHARNNPHLRATLIRSVGFFLFASACWALLPLVARRQVAGGPALYGLLLGAIGLGAVAGAFALPYLKQRLGPDRLVVGGTLGTAVAMILFALARRPEMALVASLVAGLSWIAVLATLNVSAQVALPAWVRGRGLSVFGTVMFGSLSLGSAAWGEVAALSSPPIAHGIAAAAVLAAIPLLRRFRLQTGADVDLAPAMHWPLPAAAQEHQEHPEDQGPVLVTVEYQIDPAARTGFLAVLFQLGGERRRDGAFAWHVFEDFEEQGRFLETFMLDSWAEHLRQHARVTKADQLLQEQVKQFQLSGMPKVRHLIAADLRAPAPAAAAGPPGEITRP